MNIKGQAGPEFRVTMIDSENWCSIDKLIEV